MYLIPSIFRAKSIMTFDKINFYIGYLCTAEEMLKHGLLFDDGDEDNQYEINENYTDVIHTWKCCSDLSDKLFVVGTLLTSTHRRFHQSCGNCTLSNPLDEEFSDPYQGLCTTCISNWKSHKTGIRPRPDWCDSCLSKIRSQKYFTNFESTMKPTFLCKRCIGVCVDGEFDVEEYQTNPSFFDGFNNKDQETSINIVCYHCNHPSIINREVTVCPHCNYQFNQKDKHTIDDSYDIPVDITFDKQLHVVAIPDDCLSCT